MGGPGLSHFSRMPVSLSHLFRVGSSLRVAYRVQVVTGLVLALHYRMSFQDLIIYG